MLYAFAILLAALGIRVAPGIRDEAMFRRNASGNLHEIIKVAEDHDGQHAQNNCSHTEAATLIADRNGTAMGDNQSSAVLSHDDIMNGLALVSCPVLVVCIGACIIYYAKGRCSSQDGNEFDVRSAMDRTKNKGSGRITETVTEVPEAEEEFEDLLRSGGVDVGQLRATFKAGQSEDSLARLHQQVQTGLCALQRKTPGQEIVTMSRIVRLQSSCIFTTLPERGLCVLKCTKQGAPKTGIYGDFCRRIRQADDFDEEAITTLELALGMSIEVLEEHFQRVTSRTVMLRSDSDHAERGSSFPGIETSYVSDEVWWRLINPHAEGLDGMLPNERTVHTQLGTKGQPWYEKGPRWLKWFDATAEEMALIDQGVQARGASRELHSSLLDGEQREQSEPILPRTPG